MNNPNTRRTFAIVTVILSGIVLVLTVLAILATWVGYYISSNAVVGLSVGVEKTAQALARGVDRSNDSIANLRSDIAQVEAAVTQLAQNVGNQGLIRTLLPDSVDAKIQTATQRVTDTLSAVEDTVSSSRDLYNSLNRIPGVNLPDLSTTQLGTVASTLSGVQSDVQDLRANIASARQGQVTQLNRVADLTSRIDDRLDMLSTALVQIKGDLETVQSTAVQMRRTIPNLLLVLSVLATLVWVWIIYTQVVVIRGAWAVWKGVPVLPPPTQTPVSPTPSAPVTTAATPADSKPMTETTAATTAPVAVEMPATPVPSMPPPADTTGPIVAPRETTAEAPPTTTETLPPSEPPTTG